MSLDDRNLPKIGILGTGQLAAMMARDYHALGGEVAIYGESKESPASQIVDDVFLGDMEDVQALENFFNAVDIVTLENEFFACSLLQEVAQKTGTPVYPEPEKYGLIEAKLEEKQYFDSVDVRVANYVHINKAEDIPDEPGFLKLSKGGYDGKGTYHVNNAAEAISIFKKIEGVSDVLFEHLVDYEKELSMIAATNDKEIVFYPMVETQQEHGTCRYVIYPAGISDSLEQEGREMVERIMRKLDTRGLFAFELFLTKKGELILNESAPRPHNSGHITLDSHNVSQFETHMRAVANLPLIEPEPVKTSAIMVNLLSTKAGPFDADAVVNAGPDPQSNVDLYGKKHSTVKRKMGHINLWGENQRERAEKILETLEI